MKTSLVITTINKINKNIKNFVSSSKIKKWGLIIIGDRKSPKNFNLSYGEYLDIKTQLKTNFKFAKICPENTYARKNIGYLQAIKNKSEIIAETDDDNFPKKNFFEEKKLIHTVREVKNKSWVNMYDLFTTSKQLIWPRGLPLDSVLENKIKLSKKKKLRFYLQQGVCENNPDVDAIYRLINKKINIKFKNDFFVSLGKSLSPFNSQNTIWFKKIFPLMYLPVTCTMRMTDILRSLICLKILINDNKKILFFGTTMFQKRNEHNLYKDFKDEIDLYLYNKKIINLILNLNLKKGEKNYLSNILKCYKLLIKKKFIKKTELKYLNAWIFDINKIIEKNS
jgi:hypothetical protein